MPKSYLIDDLEVQITKHRWSKRMTMRVKSGKVFVTIPVLATYSLGKIFVQQNFNWISSKIDKNSNSWMPITADYSKDKTRAKKLIEAKLSEWNHYYNFSWGRVAVRDQATRWGSASNRGNLNFSWRIMYLPESLQDYIIVHEICHLEQSNHSKDFWNLVAKTIPNYKSLRKELKKYALR